MESKRERAAKPDKDAWIKIPPLKNAPSKDPLFSGKTYSDENLRAYHKRIESFWRGWTTTIWSMPSIMSAINVVAYAAIFDSRMKVPQLMVIVILLVLCMLNYSIYKGLAKHVVMQRAFGARLQLIEERVWKIKPIPQQDLGPAGASEVYVNVSFAIFVMSAIVTLALIARSTCLYKILWCL